jgi:hypothetical protein
MEQFPDSEPQISESDLVDFCSNRCRTAEIREYIRTHWKTKGHPISDWFDRLAKNTGAPLGNVDLNSPLFHASDIQGQTAKTQNSSSLNE